jgi:hypothetical protein
MPWQVSHQPPLRHKKVWHLLPWHKPSKSWKKERKVSEDFTRKSIQKAIE